MPPNEHAADLAEIVKSAIELPPHARASFLEGRCRSNATLRAEVDSLLAHEQRASDFIETPALDLALLRQDSLRPGAEIGNYEIISLIGAGGMGEVYLAQDRQLHRRVALKLIRRGMDTADVIRRFRQEEQLLAGLNHPHIAQLYGGGLTNDGLPFFAMELVEGERLDDYCQDRHLPLPARLELFRKVCAAVSYAHQHLVIHRDIKPANIRVTAAGEPKLLDFGIAKLLDDSSAPDMTLLSLRVMTPEYASPEQIRGELATTATDIYSLGVLLYQLLTGQKPYKIDNRTPLEAARIITETEPVRPSTVLSPHRRSLRGDLDIIVLMAMRKEPHRRYSSVAQFSEDIARYLAGRTVVAHADSLGYRAAKFIRRNKIAVAAAGLVVLALTAGVIAFAWEAKIAAAQRDHAELAKKNSERMSGFLESILLAPDPSWTTAGKNRGRELTFEQLLANASARATKELADQPATLGKVLRSIGNTYRGNGQYARAEENLRAGVAAFSRIGSDDVDLTTTSYNLAQCLALEAKYDEAEVLFRKTIPFFREQAKSGDNMQLAMLAGALNDFAYLLRNKGEPRAAEELLRQALEISPRLRAPFEILRAIHLSHLGYARDDQGDLAGAEQYAREAIGEFERLAATDRLEFGNTLVALGSFLKTKGDYAAADVAVRRAEEIHRRLVGDAHPYLALALNQRAEILVSRGDYAAAEPLARKAVAIQKEQLPDGHPTGAYSLTTLGSILAATNRAAEAETLLRDALVRREKVLPAGHWLIAHTRGELGECLAAQKKSAEADALLSASYETMKAAMGEQHPRTLAALHRLTRLRSRGE